MRRSRAAKAWLTSLFILLPAGVFSSGGEDAPLSSLINRLIQFRGTAPESSSYIRKLTPPLFDYLRVRFRPEVLTPLYKAESLSDLQLRLKQQVGGEALDFGAEMFEFFEAEAEKSVSGDMKSWTAAASDRFVFFFRPGSRAEEDKDLILASSEEALAAVASSLDIQKETGVNFEILHVAPPPEARAAEDIPPTGRISVYLHPLRVSAGDKLKKSMGGMSFGATIVPEHGDKGAGRLTARIDVYYLNALSLAVLHHEIAHAALFLGSFDSGPLTALPLKGESDLKKAFFAGYKRIPPFLQEGIGDYVLYYRVLSPRWPLFPSAAELARQQLASPEYIPLARLLKEGIGFRSQRRKAYSLEAASVIDFLLQAHGPGKLKAWFLSPESESLKSFESVYGFSVGELESRWKTTLLEETSP